ncbi:hypothetical protein F2Q68_00002187 [Brassica cretica]|uniref:adenylate kinase n=1 Tax=Brassica cretica TaxID=69181 RepID=A0A8S9J7U5_BRACR|nr:hypothetical protein F2Q68_00002187 [Brassica cretica]
MANSSVDMEDIQTVDLMSELLRRMKCASKPDKRLVFIGPPGSGKGTQSPVIKDEFCLCHLSTGDMLRAAVAAKSPLGVKAKEAMDKVTGEPLIQRKDDNADVLRSRLDAFHKQTQPVIDYYAKKGNLVNIPAEKAPEEVTKVVKKVVSA